MLYFINKSLAFSNLKTKQSVRRCVMTPLCLVFPGGLMLVGGFVTFVYPVRKGDRSTGAIDFLIGLLMVAVGIAGGMIPPR
jgi:hypothetical protein